MLRELKTVLYFKKNIYSKEVGNNFNEIRLKIEIF